MVLQTVYDPNVLQIIKKFVTESARFFGADSREVSELELVTEEAAMLIISAYPDNSLDIFQITAQGKKGLFKLVLNNMGLPVDEANLPEYTIENPEKSIDGLQLHLINTLTDNFYFHNRGADGWQTILEKKLAGFRDPLGVNREVQEVATGSADSGKKIAISLATPEDAYKITRLAYYTYRYSYAKTIFYYPELLQKALENKTIIAFVARDSKGEIIAHCAYLRSSHCSELAEIGGLMSNPAYRKTTAAIRMLRIQYKALIDDDRGITLTESNLVTTHTGSQRITSKFNLTPLALKISVHEPSNFVAMDDISMQQRESFLYSVWAPHGLRDAIRIYSPENHVALIASLLAIPDFPVTVQTDTCIPTAERTLLTIEKHRKEQLAEIRINEFGTTWREELEKTAIQLSFEHFVTLHLHVPAASPIPAGLESSLLSMGFFFSGIHAQTPRNWSLLYTCLYNQSFNFEAIKLSDSVAQDLRAHVQTCYEATKN